MPSGDTELLSGASNISELIVGILSFDSGFLGREVGSNSFYTIGHEPFVCRQDWVNFSVQNPVSCKTALLYFVFYLPQHIFGQSYYEIAT